MGTLHNFCWSDFEIDRALKMKLLTAATVLLTFSLINARLCYEGKGSYDHGYDVYKRDCGNGTSLCYTFGSDGGSLEYGCGGCNEGGEGYCHDECDWDLCNEPGAIDGAGDLPKILSLILPVAYFLARLA